jgi:DMSO/TMAO reductase YedYZ molybdopterin-dependent catalytic subunit
MRKTITLISLIVPLLVLVACSEKPPEVEWELVVDGDVEQSITYTFQDITELQRARLTDILTRNPENPSEKVSWEGVTLFLLLREPGGVDFQSGVTWWTLITLADGSRHRMSLADLRGAIIALKDGEGNWLAETEKWPVRLVAPNRPSSDWLWGPVRITIHAP